MRFPYLFALLPAIAFAERPTTILEGQIFQGKTPHSHQSDFSFPAGSAAIVTLQSCEDNSEYTGCRTISRQLIDNPREFPIYFGLTGTLSSACEGTRVCLLSARVRADKKKEQIGDLITEYEIRVDRLPHPFLTVVATGLESCRDAHAGGFCLDPPSALE